MGHGRFEFDADFSQHATSLNTDLSSSQRDEQHELAYRQGFSDGQSQSRSDDSALIINLLTTIQAALQDRLSWQKSYYNDVLNGMIPTLDHFLCHLTKQIRIEAIIESNQFGLRDLLDRLSPDDDPSIHVSENVYHAITDALSGEPTSPHLPFVKDSAIADHDFEIRWRNGGVVYSSEELIARYRSILTQYHQQ